MEEAMCMGAREPPTRVQMEGGRRAVNPLCPENGKQDETWLRGLECLELSKDSLLKALRMGRQVDGLPDGTSLAHWACHTGDSGTLDPSSASFLLPVPEVSTGNSPHLPS